VTRLTHNCCAAAESCLDFEMEARPMQNPDGSYRHTPGPSWSAYICWTDDYEGERVLLTYCPWCGERLPLG